MPFAYDDGRMSRMAGGREAPATRVKLTYDDFVHFPDDGLRHELIAGEHYVTPSPNIKHQTVSGNLFLAIGMWLDAHPIGRVYHAPLDVVFSDFDVVEPDLLYISNERRKEIVTTQHVRRGVPELVVEIGSLSTQTRDETIKRRLYERAGVSEYWFVDADAEVVRVHRREGDTFSTSELSRAAGDGLATLLLPGLEVPLDRVFRD